MQKRQTLVPLKLSALKPRRNFLTAASMDRSSTTIGVIAVTIGLTGGVDRIRHPFPDPKGKPSRQRRR